MLTPLLLLPVLPSRHLRLVHCFSAIPPLSSAPPLSTSTATSYVRTTPLSPRSFRRCPHLAADNAPALAFYTKRGYTPDEIDPTRIAEEDEWEDVDEDGEPRSPDYRILSKVLSPSSSSLALP